MSKNKKSNKPAKNAQDVLIKANNAAVTDNQNLNEQHNTKKGSLGPNTKR